MSSGYSDHRTSQDQAPADPHHPSSSRPAVAQFNHPSHPDMTVPPLDGRTTVQSRNTMDVKLPPIRSLDDSFDRIANHGAPSHPRHDAFAPRPPRTVAPDSPPGPAGRATLPPLPRFSDPRSRAEQQQQLPSLTQSSQGYHSSSTSTTSPSMRATHSLGPDHSSPRNVPLNVRQPSRPNSTPHDSPPPGESRAPYSHPFFDRGKDKSFQKPDEAGSTGSPMKLNTDRLEEVERALQVARAIVMDGINGHVLSQASLDSATEATGRAWSLLRDAGASQAAVQSLLLRLPEEERLGNLIVHPSSRGRDGHSREGTILRSDTNGNVHGVSQSTPSHIRSTVPSGSIFGLNKKPSSAVANNIPDHLSNPSRSGYDGQDVAVSRDRSPPSTSHTSPQSLTVRSSPSVSSTLPLIQPNDNVPRPPTSVIRSTSAYNVEQSTASKVSSEHETSFMYAPPSMRKRLAAMYDQPGPQQSHSPPSQPRPNPLNRTLSSSSAPGLPYQPWHKTASHILPPPPPTTSQTHPQHYQHEHDMMNAERRVPPSDPNTKYKKRSRAPAPSCCKGCGTNETPEWRRGPDGARTLCNACGLHFAKVSKKKPATSEGAPDPGYHPPHPPTRLPGIGPVDPSHKSLFN